MIGATLSHYRIVERIGEGGMGVVYRAHDERLDRDVALKVLAADLLSDRVADKRFRQEARALSRLNHPNICAVYDFDSECGVSFLAMEYIAGRTLAQVAPRAPMAEDEILRLALQLAEGLAAAHREGVVHRDLKPSNIVVTADGRLKILDFGLAKLAQPASTDGATISVLETQGIAGTLPYMAPEQLRGAAVDARTDLYAVGAVLYEIATARRPFDHPATPALTDAILHAAPIPPTRLRPDLSSALEGVVLRCLEKDPSLRYQSAGDLLADLKRLQRGASSVTLASPPGSRGKRLARWWPIGVSAVVLLAVVAAITLNWFAARDRVFGRPASSALRIESLGVLPFDNLSGDPSQDYFAAGMTETLTAAVSQIPAIRVIGRTTMMQFTRSPRPPIAEIARLANVDAVIEGSAQRAGDRVRITAQLVAASPERHVWANSYDREMRDVLTIHSDVAQAIAREIQAKLTPETQTRLAGTRPVNPAAYEAYLRGRAFFAAPTGAGFDAAEAAFREAISLDGNFAPAYSSLGYLYIMAGVAGRVRGRPVDQARRIRECVTRALELDPTQAEAVAVEGTLNLYYDWDWPSAERRLKRALELNPNEGLLYHPYADYLLVVGRLEESLDVVKRGAALDPLSPLTNVVVAGHLIFLRRYDESVALLRGLIERNPSVGVLHSMLGVVLWDKGEYRAALAELFPASDPIHDAATRALATGGPRAAALAIARALAAPVPPSLLPDSTRPAVPFGAPRGTTASIAEWYALAGDIDAASTWLEQAYQNRAPALLHVKASPSFDSLRTDPRFAALLKRIGFPD